jgi:malonate transporter
MLDVLGGALNVFVMARQYDVWVTQASGSVLIGTLMSVVTLTAIMWMVKTQALPLPLFH